MTGRPAIVDVCAHDLDAYDLVSEGEMIVGVSFSWTGVTVNVEVVPVVEWRESLRGRCPTPEREHRTYDWCEQVRVIREHPRDDCCVSGCGKPQLEVGQVHFRAAIG